MLKIRIRACHLFSAASLLASAYCAAEPSDAAIHWYEFTFENDVLAIINQSDDGYTNGVAYHWGRNYLNSFEALDLPKWIEFLSHRTYVNKGSQGQYSIQYGIYQKMYTPTDIDDPELIVDDRPYAGILMWSAKLNHFADNKANNISLELGIAGPGSMAEQSQIFIHDLFDCTEPMGWDNQINNEVVFRIAGEHIYRFYDYNFSPAVGFDLNSYSKAGIGNLRSDVGTGLTWRIGELLPQTYASINPKSSKVIHGIVDQQFHWQLFASVFASYVFNDITLNGNTFSDSHSVDLEHEQILFSAGLILTYKQWALSMSSHRGNEQFKGQESINKYGSMSISYSY